jgi:hypothetical protein
MANKPAEHRVGHPMSDIKAQTVQAAQAAGRFFEIHVKGHLNSQWSDWLGGLQVRLLDNSEMILSGYIVDQAALMGVLNGLYSLNLTLLSVNEVDQNDRHQ